MSDGAAAIILARDEDLPTLGRSRARFRAASSAVDTVRLGERADPSFFAGKHRAAQKAYAMAGLTAADIQLAEVYDSYSGAQLQALEALGLAARPELPVNLSGGLLGQGAPVGATGGRAGACSCPAIGGALFRETRAKRASLRIG